MKSATSAIRARPDKKYAVAQNALLHERAADVLRNMVIEGELAVGSRIPELELCGLLGISRTPLREAIKVLAGEGLLQLLPNRGAIVTEPDVAQIDDTIETVGLLEAGAARMACNNASDRDLKTITSLHEQMVEYFAKGDSVRYFRTNQRFHDAIIAAAGNDVLTQTHARLNAHLKRVRYQRMREISPDRKREFIDEHQIIVDNLVTRNAEGVQEAVINHLASVGRMIAGSQPDRRSGVPKP